MKLKNDLILKVAKGKKTDKKPVWLMRQAGRILPEYRTLRAKVGNFKALLYDPALACEVTIMPINSLGVDAAIIFSDILVVAEAMNLPYKMVPGVGPRFENTIKTTADLKNLKICNGKDDIDYTIEAIRLTKRELNGKVPLIGFAACPWTLFAYMIEGKGSKTFAQAKKMLYTQADLSHQLLQMITQSTINYLNDQVEAGADMLQIFDSWAGILSPEQYRIFALPYIKQICDTINSVPLTVFAKGAYFALAEVGQLNCNTVGLDWNMPIGWSRTTVGNNKVLQGNLDPCMLYANASELKKSTLNMLREFGPHHHIVNLGHGVYPDTPLDNVKLFVDTVKAYQP